MIEEKINLEIVKRIPRMYDKVPNFAKEIFSSNCVHHINGFIEEKKGPEMIILSINEIQKVFSGSKTTFDDIIVGGNRVAVRWTWQGTNRVTGAQWTFHGQSFFIFQNGKVIEYWANDNRYLEMLEHGFKIVPPVPPTGK